MSIEDKQDNGSNRTGKLLRAFLTGCAPAVYVLTRANHFLSFDGSVQDAELFALVTIGALCALMAGYIISTAYPENGRDADKAIYAVIFGLGFAVLNGCIVLVGCTLRIAAAYKK